MGTAAIWNHEQGRVDTDDSVLSLAHTHTHTRARVYRFAHTRDRDETKEWKDNDPSEGAEGDEPNICVRLFVLLFAGFDANLIRATLLLHDPCLLAHHNNVFIK